MIEFSTIAKLIEEYRAKAEKTPYVQKPWAWAIYQAWKEVDAKEKPREKPRITNADRIRQMTDEELAEWATTIGRTFGEEYEGFMSCLDWLKKEVDDDNKQA